MELILFGIVWRPSKGQHISIRKQLRENIRAQYQKTQWYENILGKFRNWKLKCSLLIKRKTKQNEQKQTNLEKQKTKQNSLTLSTPHLCLHHIFFFNIYIGFSYTLDNMGENLTEFLHFNCSKNIPRYECNLSASSQFIVMNSEQLTLGQVPTLSLPAVDEKWGQPARWPWECECESLSKRGYWRCSFSAHAGFINSKDEWRNAWMNHTKA